VPHEGWTIAVDSQQTGVENGAAANAIDGDPATYWHTRWDPTVATLPHVVVLDLGAPYTLSGVTYLPRPAADVLGSENGRIGRYRIETSADGFRWRRAARGTWADDATLKTARFAARDARYVRLNALSEAGGRGQWTSAAELDVLGMP
jgi:hypothetical protein